MLSDEYLATLGFLRARAEARRGSIDDLVARRLELEAYGDLAPMPEGVTSDTLSVGGVPCGRFAPVGARRDRLVVYLHGGGYCRGSVKSHRSLAARLAVDVGAPVLVVDYRLAPEHPYPAALEDARTVVDWVTGSAGVAPEALALVGDSAGGGLVVATLLALRDSGAELPACAALISPWLDLRPSDASRTGGVPSDPVVTQEDLELSARWYLGRTPDTHPMVSPVLADLSALPPLLIHVGSGELLLEDARAFEVAARAAGTRVELVIAPDMVHCWHLFAGVPEADAAVEDVADFVTAHWDGAEGGPQVASG